MENENTLKGSKGEEMIKDLSSNKSYSFLNKKRKELIEPFEIIHLGLDESFKEDSYNFFNNKINYENEIIDEKTNITLNDTKEEEFSNINKIKEEKKNNIELNEKIMDIKVKNEIIKKNIIEKKKNDISCFALDLLDKNGEFQIKFSKNTNNTYILKIKEVEIKDDYFKQIKYAKHHGKYSSLKFSAPNNKYWLQRYYYFSKFDKGIIMDKESWYSVTPEEIAKYIAKLIKGKTIIDGFCGCGGNVIQFSKYCSKVYAIDISKTKLDMCKNNCKVYHCENNITFIHSDFLKMKNKIKADYIFLSPPWGGTKYKSYKVYSIKKFMYPDITEIIRVSINVAKNILFFLPRNLDLDELFNLCSSVKNEIEENSGENLFFDIKIIKSNNRIKSLLIIFGHHIKDYFSKHKLEKFLKQYYEKINEKNLNELYSFIKIIGCFRFFKEEHTYRLKKSKDSKNLEVSYLNEYIKNLLNENYLKIIVDI